VLKSRQSSSAASLPGGLAEIGPRGTLRRAGVCVHRLPFSADLGRFHKREDSKDGGRGEEAGRVMSRGYDVSGSRSDALDT